MPRLIDSIYLDPKGAIDNIAGKGVRVTWDWRELMGNEHNRAFTISKMTRIDILKDLKATLKTAIAEGLTGSETRALLENKMRAAGWWGNRRIKNPATGLLENVRLGTPWRIDTIVRTNTQSAFMAGKWRRFYDNREDRPYLEYVAILDGSTRDSHRRLNGFIAPVNAAAWNRIFPPNGYNCRCRVRALTEKQAAARNKDIKIPSDFPDSGFSGNPGKFSDVENVRRLRSKAAKAKDLKSFRSFINDQIRLDYLTNVGIPGISISGASYLLNILGPTDNLKELSINKSIKPKLIPGLVASTTGAVQAYVDSQSGRIYIRKKGTKRTYYIFSERGAFLKSSIMVFFGKRYKPL